MKTTQGKGSKNRKHGRNVRKYGRCAGAVRKKGHRTRKGNFMVVLNIPKRIDGELVIRAPAYTL